jgi:hypothetical protein
MALSITPVSPSAALPYQMCFLLPYREKHSSDMSMNSMPEKLKISVKLCQVLLQHTFLLTTRS